LAERTKPVLLDEAEVRRVMRREYRPGRPGLTIAAPTATVMP
jgi:hypothetical protein